MTDAGRTFLMQVASGGEELVLVLEPADDLLERFLTQDVDVDTYLSRTLVERAEQARTGTASSHGSNNFGILFDAHGVTLQHNYLDGEPSVTVDLDNFVDIVTAYSAAAVVHRAAERQLSSRRDSNQ